ncbi:MAG: hypothetical protein KF901_05650 [Myxococcales bacterium]|nr:hypothetical protein [Myxococcales bacterium]
MLRILSQTGHFPTVMLVAVLGCVTPEERLFQPKWSDDGTKAIVLIKRWRSGPRVFDTPTSDGRSYELRAMELDGAVIWSERFESSPAAWSLFVVEAYAFYQAPGGREFVLQPLDGGQPRRLDRWAVPSPDGRWLYLESIECEPCSHVGEFVSSRTLERVGEQMRAPSPDGTDPRRATWQTMWIDEEHVVRWSTDHAFAVGVDGTLYDPAPRPTCNAPATRGGVRDDQGRPLHGELVGDRVVLTIGESDGPPWPLRCWPHGGPEEW